MHGFAVTDHYFDIIISVKALEPGFAVYIAFGICIGMQLLCKHSEEYDTDCLGIFDVDVKRFIPQQHEYKVPQMGWNTIEHTSSPIFSGFDKPEFVYFIHSFYAPLCQHTIAQTDYIQPYSSALHKDNFYATQFHPEKSGEVGERILRNFIELKG